MQGRTENHVVMTEQAGGHKKTSCSHAVVIIGNSFAGRRCASILKQHHGLHVTVLDANDFSEYTPGTLRALVLPSHAPALLAEQTNGVVIGAAERVELLPPLLGKSVHAALGPRVTGKCCEMGDVARHAGKPFAHLHIVIYFLCQLANWTCAQRDPQGHAQYADAAGLRLDTCR